MKRYLQNLKVEQCKITGLSGFLGFITITTLVYTIGLYMLTNLRTNVSSLNFLFFKTGSNDVFSTLPRSFVDSRSHSVTSLIADKAKHQSFKTTLRDKVKENSLTPTLVNKSIDTESLKNMAHLFKVEGVNCRAVYDRDIHEIRKAKRLAAQLENRRTNFTDTFYLKEAQNCETFKKNRGYILSPLTEEEQNFPIAFSLLVFKNSEHVERLLRAIYRPQNFYCIHVDKKSPESFYLAVKAVATCFTNVFLTSNRIDVRWGQFSVLEPELMCMKELWRYKKWKYFINLTGQEFPLKNNWELVQILSAYNGANDIEGTVKRANVERWNNTTPPAGIRPIKGSVHITVNRDFVDYILHKKASEVLLNWTKLIWVPDETFFATLNHNTQLGIRGAYKGEPETDPVIKPFLTRFKNWRGMPCAWKYVRDICILTSGDLPRLGRAKHLFANKFYIDHDRNVIGCLEEKLFNDTRDEYMGVKIFNSSYYANLGFVTNQV